MNCSLVARIEAIGQAWEQSHPVCIAPKPDLGKTKCLVLACANTHQWNESRWLPEGID